MVLYNVVFIGRFDDAKRRDADVPSRWIQSFASGSSAADCRAQQLLSNAQPTRGKETNHHHFPTQNIKYS